MLNCLWERDDVKKKSLEYAETLSQHSNPSSVACFSVVALAPHSFILCFPTTMTISSCRLLALDNPVTTAHISIPLDVWFFCSKMLEDSYFLQTKVTYLAWHSQIPAISTITYFFSPFSSKSVWSTSFSIHQWSHMKSLHLAFAHVVLPTWNGFPYFLLH